MQCSTVYLPKIHFFVKFSYEDFLGANFCCPHALADGNTRGLNYPLTCDSFKLILLPLCVLLYCNCDCRCWSVVALWAVSHVLAYLR